MNPSTTATEWTAAAIRSAKTSTWSGMASKATQAGCRAPYATLLSWARGPGRDGGRSISIGNAAALGAALGVDLFPPAHVTSGRRPVWLLDIDGVLNARYVRHAWGDVRTTESTIGGVTYRLTVSDAMVDRIRGIVARYGIDLRLCSTWCEVPSEIKRIYGLDLPPEIKVTNRWSVNDAKITAVLARVAEGSPVIWTDDQIPFRWADGRPGVCAVTPDDHEGITPWDLDRIDGWCAELAAARGDVE